MSADASLQTVIAALGLPPGARVDARVPKKLLVEQGAPTAADKRAIQEGIEELQWFAACKSATIGVPSFADAVREYLEIAVVGCVFRADAAGKPPKAARLIELIHRAIPYPVLLVTADAQGVTVSAAHKRQAQNEPGRTVIESLVAASNLRLEQGDAAEAAFLSSMALAQQSRTDLFALYSGWQSRIEALSAARLTGDFAAADDVNAIQRRRAALDAHTHIAKEIDLLRGRAKREKQLNRRVDLNIAIQRLEAELADNKKSL